MESHYKDSLSTAIVNILLQCGFENSSKRALDELIGMSLNYMRNVTVKISNLTNECNLQETDILIGLGALKLHGHNLDELFDFLHNYNEIFPPPPQTFFGPIPLKTITTKTAVKDQKNVEEKPIGIVSWAPEMASSLATIGMKLKNRQIVSDPNFDRSNVSPLLLQINKNCIDYRPNDQSKSTISNKIQKYGSNCTYRLPPEAYPNKYEPPTIDVDSNGAVIGLNGKLGKLPDPFINVDSEEEEQQQQDLLRRREKSRFQERIPSKLHYNNQLLFNGIRQQQQQQRRNKLNKSHEELSSNHRLLLLESSSTNAAGNADINVPSGAGCDNIAATGAIVNAADEDMKENIGKMHNNHNNHQICPYSMANNHSDGNSGNHHQIDRNVISDDVWNAALQATVDQSELFISTASNANATTATGTASSSCSIVTSSLLINNNNDPTAQSNRSYSKKAKKHKRNSSYSSSRPKKSRRIEVNEKIVAIDSQVYKNESTMDSYVSDRSVPYSSPPSDREPLLYNRNDKYLERVSVLREKSPSYSPINNFVPTNSIYYKTELIPSSPPIQSVTKPFKAKKKSSRKTHFSNKRKKKSFYPPSTVPNNFSSMINHHQHQLHHHQLEDSSNRLEFNDNASISQRSLSINYDHRSNTPQSPHPPIDMHFEDSDDDRTEPMVESSEELIKMLEMTDDTIRRQQQNSVHAIESPPPLQQIVNSNQQNTRINNMIQDTHNQIGGTTSLSGGGSSGGIRMKIKFRKSKNSIIRGASSIVNSNTDLSSPIQSPNHSDDKNSISERLQLMQYHSPLSDIDETRHQHSSFDNKSSNHSNYDIHPHSPTYSSMQESPRDLYRFEHSVASGAVSSTFSKPPTPNKLIIRPSNFKINRFNSSSTHSSPKTLPALDDCDKVPNLQIKTNKSVKKRKRSRLSSGSKKIKSKKSVKLKANHEQPIQKPLEKPFVSVDDIFSDEDDNTKSEINHLNTISLNSRPSISVRPIHQSQSQLPLIFNSPPPSVPASHGMSIPSVNSVNSKSSVKKSSKSKHKSINSSTLPVISQIENKTVYNYPCLPGEAHYTSEDGKVVYICPICSGEDDGFLMLGCERCEDWYHGRCLKVYNPPPEDQDWFCQRCLEDMLKGSQEKGNSKSNSKSRTKKK